MSAQLSPSAQAAATPHTHPLPEVTTRVLIGEKSENAAHELDSTLRNAGIATKLSISDDLMHVEQLLKEGTTDIALLTDKMEGLDKILPRLRENAPHTPVILVTHDNAPGPGWSVSSALGLGATDAVPADCGEQLALVVKRELQHICQRQHYSQVRRALKEAEQRCQLLLQGADAAIAYVHEGMHIHANRGYLEMFGYADGEELIGVSLVDLLDEESGQVLKQSLKRVRSGAEDVEFEFAGSANHSECAGSMTLTSSKYEGEPCLQVTVRPKQAKSEQAASDEAANPQAADELEIPGLLKTIEVLQQGTNSDVCLFFVSIDHFDQYRSEYGLLGAQSIAQGVWSHLQNTVDASPCARLNNFQYVLAISGDELNEIQEQADAHRHSVSELILEINGKTVRPTISLSGIQVAEDAELNGALDDAYRNWLDDVKDGHSNQVSMPNMDNVATTESWNDAKVILKQITDAIEKKTFVLLFQPVISLRGDSDEHYEVFLRMTGPNGEQIEPGKFLQTAIDNNVAGKIDRWVILQAIKMLSVHRAKGNATRLTINVTSNSIVDPEFVNWLGVAIKAARLPSDAVIFQITERDATTYLRQTREFVEGLRNMHCRASLSRFGLIDQPFDTLKHIPADLVKLDGNVVTDDEQDRSSLVETIKQLQGQGKLTIVPMVENATLLSTLWQAGANYIQGHYMQEPSTEMNYDFSTEE
ncbi:MAG: EAL domain-containing protein [Pseudomonadota bacterium]